MQTKKIAILGAGNVASAIGIRAAEKNIEIVQIWRRGEKILNADLYIIAVPDDAIDSVVALLPTSAKWVHTSANFDETKYNKHTNKGVLYPLQTFTKGVPVKWNFPLFVYSENKDFEACILDLARVLSDDDTNVKTCDKETLKQLHVAAVFACNFTNHLWSISADILKKHNLEFVVLQPLIHQTVGKLSHTEPHKAQTGPAIRKDKKTMKKQAKLLSPWYRKIYKMLSRSIAVVKF